MRSEQNADDYATLADVVDEVKKEYIDMGKGYDYISCILATSPLITLGNFQKGLDILIKTEADSVRPVVKFSYPIQRAFHMVNGKVEMFNPEHKNTRSQDLVDAFHDAGQFYWMKFDEGLRGDNKYGFEISEIETQDIDTEIDWKLAELKYNSIKSHEG
jgi:N-acylneuraminate cytidylyltransferase